MTWKEFAELALRTLENYERNDYLERGAREGLEFLPTQGLVDLEKTYAAMLEAEAPRRSR